MRCCERRPGVQVVLIGVISDTHGLIRPAALTALSGADLIIHAGDVGKPEVLDRLRQVAPTHAVRGNIDTQGWSANLPPMLDVDVNGLRLHVLHNISELAVEPVREEISAVVFGHSHKPSIEVREGVLFLSGKRGPEAVSSAGNDCPGAACRRKA